MLEAVARAANIPLALIARASGPLYLAFLPDSDNTGIVDNLALLAHEIFTLGRSRNGDAALLFAPGAVRAVSRGQSLQNTTSALAARIKSAFDPNGIFAPGRVL